MTDLQISLIVIGAIIIIAVIVYNKIQEYRAKKRLEQVFSDPSDDILMTQSSLVQSQEEQGLYKNTVPGVRLEDPLDGDETISITTDQDIGDQKIEPYLTVEENAFSPQQEEDLQEHVPEDTPTVSEDLSKESEPESEKVEPVSEPISEDAPEPLSPYRFELDDIIDQAILIRLKEVVHAENILSFSQKMRRIGNKPVHFVGIANEPSHDGSLWQAILPGKSYQQLKVGVQIANRTGAITDREFSDFVTKLSQMAESLGGEIALPKADVVLKKAKELFQFVLSHDARLGINVKSQGRPWEFKTIKQIFDMYKFKQINSESYILQDDHNNVLFSLTMNMDGAEETVSSLTLLLDVPCVSQGRDGFSTMVQYAKSIASRLRGIIVDDADRMLSDPMLNDIANQVEVFYSEMKSFSIEAGSPRALRLFN